jgi:hypothetical protein
MERTLKIQQSKAVNSNQDKILSGEDGFTKNSDIISVMNNFTYIRPQSIESESTITAEGINQQKILLEKISRILYKQ